jgi:hypothetical protein
VSAQNWVSYQNPSSGRLLVPVAILSQARKSGIFVDLELQTIRVTGPEDLIVAVAQQLAWLVAACRASPVELAYSHVSFHQEASEPDISMPAFRIASEVIPLSPDEPRSCWNEVVGSSVIVAGFPIPERFLDETGLEIPLEVMASLGGMRLATQHDGGYLLKGRSIMFVPVERRGDSVQWHLVQRKGSRIRYQDAVDLCPVRLPVERLDEEGLSSTRAFLGWCPSSINNLGMS